MKHWIRIFIAIILVLVADLVTKHFLFDVDYYNLIPNVISIANNGGNTGAAWGMFSDKTFALAMVSIIMIIALIIFNIFNKSKSLFYDIAFGLIVGGAIGNLVDRLYLGYVRDFIYLDFFSSFPVFNVADSCLCVGAVMLAIHILFFSKDKNEK